MKNRPDQHLLARVLLAAVLSAATWVAPASARAAEMVLPSEIAVTHWKTRYMNEFADQVKKRTNGALIVKVFPAGQLYNDQDAMAALGTGAVHMVWPLSVRLETLDPRAGIVNLPFTLTDELMENRCFAGGASKLLSSYVEGRKLEVLGLLRTADLMFVFKNRDVQKLEDLKGAKVRVTGGKIFQDMVRSMDASPVSLPASEMSTALSQGSVDGVFTSPAGWAEMIGITAKHAWYVPGMSIGTYAVVVDQTWFAKLPADQRKAISDTIDEIAQRQWREAIEADRQLVEKMIGMGAVHRSASPAEIARWKERAAAVNKSFTDKYPDTARSLAALQASCAGKK
ncbi:MAG: TRAP transporter substrate-binding protein DctP [Burkholderiaceae bacterium]|nr:TRAP transporter substrate-binding protein DctP [Burkholderiaceae bacterium]